MGAAQPPMHRWCACVGVGSPQEVQWAYIPHAVLSVARQLERAGGSGLPIKEVRASTSAAPELVFPFGIESEPAWAV